MFKDLVYKSRTRRRFDQAQAISEETLRELVDLARLAPSGSNKQPLKYMLSFTPERNALVFPHLGWAGYIANWDGPAEGERPAAYILILCDTAISEDSGVDHGIAAQTIMLGAAERGLGGCIIGSAKKEPLQRDLHIPERYRIQLVLALGVPAETVVVETAGADGDIRYWRDADGVHHVPKRALDEIIIG